MKRKEKKGSYDGTGAAVVHGILDLFRRKKPFGKADDELDMNGKTCLITGANSGLGYAAARRLACMGADVIMACRRQIPEAGERLREKTGSHRITMEYVDLEKLRTVGELAARLKKQGRMVDVLISNAGVVCRSPRLTPDGFDTMFQVNYLAKYHLVNTFISHGLFRTGNKDGGAEPSRLIFVSSETHRTSLKLDMTSLGKPPGYGMKTALSYYGYDKLLMTIFARELARRYSGQGPPDLSVFTLCPGPVATNIGREAPKMLRPVLRLVFFLFFRSPMKASDPVIFFASDPSLSGRTDIYLHLMVRKEPDPRTNDPETGKSLWLKSGELIRNKLNCRCS